MRIARAKEPAVLTPYVGAMYMSPWLPTDPNSHCDSTTLLLYTPTVVYRGVVHTHPTQLQWLQGNFALCIVIASSLDGEVEQFATWDTHLSTLKFKLC